MNMSRWRMSITLATIVAEGLCAPGQLVGQTPDRARTSLWAGAAVGPTTPYDIGVVATGALRYNRMVVRVRYASAGEYAGDWFEDVGLLVGVVVTPLPARSQLAVSAGVGRTRCRHCGSLIGQPEPAPATGFLLDAEGRLALTRGFGLTAQVFGDLNSSLSFGGVAVGLFLGGL